MDGPERGGRAKISDDVNVLSVQQGTVFLAFNDTCNSSIIYYAANENGVFQLLVV